MVSLRDLPYPPERACVPSRSVSGAPCAQAGSLGHCPALRRVPRRCSDSVPRLLGYYGGVRLLAVGPSSACVLGLPDAVHHAGGRQPPDLPVSCARCVGACTRSLTAQDPPVSISIRRQAATGSCTRSRQWDTQLTWFRSAGVTVFPSVNVNGVRPSKEAWQRAAL